MLCKAVTNRGPIVVGLWKHTGEREPPNAKGPAAVWPPEHLQGAHAWWSLENSTVFSLGR